MDAPHESRFDFPQPDESGIALMRRINRLMLDMKPRSREEIQDALRTRKEVSARIRDARRIGWPYNDSRADGPMDDGVYRWRLLNRPDERLLT